VREEETKLAVDSVYALPDLTDGGGSLRVEPGGSRTLRAVYWDTPDLRLARNGITLRHRTGEGDRAWQLKLPMREEGATVREEIAERGRPGTVPRSLQALVTGWVRSATLTPVATLRTDRELHRILGPDGAELADLTDDTVSILDGRRVLSRFREIEVERRGADPATMAWLRDRLVEAGAVEGEFTPKVVHALGPLATAGSDLRTPPTVGRRSPAGTVVAYSLATGLHRLIDHDAPVRRSARDAIHQMRVACRRLRSDLRTFGPLVDPDWAGGLRDELKWLAGSLGAARDLEVLRERIAGAAREDPLAPLDADAVARIDAVLAEREERAQAEVRTALDSQRYVDVLERVVEAARQPVLTPAADLPADQALVPLVGKAWRKLEKEGRRLAPDDPDEHWHRVRILAKRARYAAEAAAVALGTPASKLGSGASSVQDVLGEHQDAVFAGETLAEIAEQHSDDVALVLACGRLVERERAAARQARVDFPRIWKKATAPKRTRWLSA
jgi:CHAD domain-containing protein